MKFRQSIGLAVVLLTFTGCGPSKPKPSGVLYEGKHVSEWGDIVKDPGADREARLEAAKVLAKLGKEGQNGKEAIQALHTAAASDEDASVRGWAAVALVYAARGTPFPVGQVTGPVFKEAVGSSDEELRAEVTRMLERMPPSSAGGPPGGKMKGGAGTPGEKKAPSGKDMTGPAPDKTGSSQPSEKEKR